MFRWTDRTILFQVMCSVSVIFAAYAIAFIIQLLISCGHYQDELILMNNEVTAEETAFEAEHILQTAIAQTKFYLKATQQLIEKESQVILDVLDNRGKFDIHPVDWESYTPVSLSLAAQYPSYRGIAFHKEIFQLRGTQRRQAQQLQSLDSHFEASRRQRFGVNGTVAVDQIYIQFVRDGTGDLFSLYSRPPAQDLKDEWSGYVDGYKIGDIYHYEVFQTAKKQRETVINFLSPDLQYETKQVTTIAHPLIQDNVFWGVIFWEVQQAHAINQTVVPNTFW